MKVVKILGVVFGALFLLTGIGLLAGSAVVGAGQTEFDEQLAQQGLAGPVEGRVTAVEGGTIYTVDYTDKHGNAQTGTGPVSDGTTPPAQGAAVDLYYSTVDPAQIIILDFPGGDFAGIAGVLRTAGISCLVVGAILLLAGIIALVTGRQRAAAPAGPAAYAGTGQVPPGSDPVAPGQTPAPQDSPPHEGQAYPPQPGAGAQPGPDIDPTPTQSFPEGQTPTAPPDSNRPG